MSGDCTRPSRRAVSPTSRRNPPTTSTAPTWACGIRPATRSGFCSKEADRRDDGPSAVGWPTAGVGIVRYRLGVTETPEVESVLPELRNAWWEHGLRRRAETGVLGVFAELPKLVVQAVAIAWRADRLRTLIVAAATLTAGAMATFGLLSTQRLLVELFAGGPTPDRVRAALPALVVLASVTAVRGALGIAVGYAQNGLTPRVNQEAERRLFEVTTAVRLDAFDADAFADDMERASRGS